MAKRRKVPPPFCTGGGGYDFEELVATTYLVAMLANEVPRGCERGVIKSVSFQQRYKGANIDDIIIESPSQATKESLFLQVKHTLTFSDNPTFNKIIKESWNDFNKKNVSLGIVLSSRSYHKTVAMHLQELLIWARTSSDSSDFIKKIRNISKNVGKYEKLFRNSLGKAKDRRVNDDELWKFLKCFVILDYDLEGKGSRDTVETWNKLRKLLRNQDVNRAKQLYRELKYLVSQFRKNGGTITIDTVRDNISKEYEFNIPSNLKTKYRQIKESCLNHSNNQIKRHKISTKYIPNVFVEIDEIKEKCRYFMDPLLFWKKIIEDIKRTDFSYLNDSLKELRIKPVEIRIPDKFNKGLTVDNYKKLGVELEVFLHTQLEQLKKCSIEKVKDKVPKDKIYYFDEIKYRYENLWKFERKIERLIDYIEALKSRVIILTSSAGKGKTNFVCDLVDNFLTKKSSLSLLFSAKDFDDMALVDLRKYILDCVFSGSYTGSFDDFMEEIRQICKKDGSMFTLIIDGLNENMNLPVFRNRLELLIEYLLKYNFVKILLTCRTEYFKQRFENLETPSFKDEVIFINNIHSKMEDRSKERLFYAYFRFFKISPANIYGDAYHKLVEEPLLLRIFCETYGDPQLRKSIKLPDIYDICNESLFSNYLERKIKDIQQDEIGRTGFRLGRKANTINLLNEIASHMITNQIFANIPLNDIANKSNQEELYHLIDEDIMLHRSLKDGEPLDDKNEVINFTFDELRDYIIAFFLIESFLKKEGMESFEKRLSSLINPELSISEGVGRYLYYIAKRRKDVKLVSLIEGKDWFQRFFLKCIFSVDDKFISRDDIKAVMAKFKENKTNSLFISQSLMARYDVEAFKNLNIDILIEILKTLNDKEYNELVNAVFDDDDEYHAFRDDRWRVSKVLYYFNIENNLKDNVLKKNPQFHNMAKILIFLFGIRYKWSAWSRTSELYEEYAKIYPEKAIKLLLDLACVKISSIIRPIFNLLSKFSHRRDLINNAFCNRIADDFIKTKLNPQTSNNIAEDSIIEFLIKTADERKGVYSKTKLEFLLKNYKYNKIDKYDVL